jgi:hypothetical protein
MTILFYFVKELDVSIDIVANVIILGHHINTQYHDVDHAIIGDDPCKSKVIHKLLNKSWLANWKVNHLWYLYLIET